MPYTNATAYSYLYTDVKDFLYNALLFQLMTSQMAEIRVYKSDPLDAGYIPGIGINKVNIDEDSSGIGLVTQQGTLDPQNGFTTYKGSYMREVVEVRVFHHNADERDKLAIFLLGAMFAIREDLLMEGLIDIRLSGGRDEQDNTLMSQPLFMSSLTMSYLLPLVVTSTESTAGAITGVPVIAVAPKMK